MSDKRDVCIYLFDTSALPYAEEIAELFLTSLPTGLSERCERASNNSLKTERVFLYTLLLYALSKKGITHDKCELLFTEYEKPYLKSGGCEFSLSHSDGLVCVAVSDEKIGVDVQGVSKERARVAARICGRFFGDFSPCSYSLSDYIANVGAPSASDPTVRAVTAALDFNSDSISFTEGDVTLQYSPKDSFMRWAECESLLKLDGRGFVGCRDIENICDVADVFSATLLRDGGGAVCLSVAVSKNKTKEN